MNPKDKDKVIGPGSPMKLVKSSWECGISKQTEEAQRKQSSRGCPKGHRSP